MQIRGLGVASVASPGQGFVLGYVCGVVWYLGSCYWIFTVMHLHGGLDWFTSAAVLLIFSLYMGLHHALFGAVMAWLAQSGRLGVRALAVAPPLWVAIELLRCRVIGVPWDLLGTSQIDNSPLAHLSTVTGVYGLSFAIMVINMGFAAALLSPKPRRGILLFASTAGALVLQSGALLPPAQQVADRYAVLVQGNIPVLEGSSWTTDYYRKTVDELVELSKVDTARGPALAGLVDSKASSGSADLIVWPENPAPFYEHDPNLQIPLANLARTTGANVIAGGTGIDPSQSGQEPKIYNSAMLFAPDGQMVGRYDKIHLVPFGEFVPFQKLLFFAEKLTQEVGNFSRGNSRTPFFLIKSSGPPLATGAAGATGAGTAAGMDDSMASMAGMEGMANLPGMPARSAPTAPAAAAPDAGKVITHSSTRAGVFICYESVFPDEIRQYADNGADYFVNLSNDGWYGDSSAWAQHLNMARMRAVENQRWLLFATNTGQTAAVDPDGRIVARAPRQQRTALLAPFAVNSVKTFYTLHGDLFAIGCVILLIVAVLGAYFRRPATA